MAMVDVADSHPKSTGLIWGLAATRRSVYIHQMNPLNSRGHNDSIIVVVIIIINIIIIITFFLVPQVV